MWFRNMERIGELVKRWELKPVPEEYLARDEIPFEIERGEMRIKIPPFPGGMRNPHLHFKGEVFLLNEEQWGEFSKQIVEDFKAKLSSVKTVNFEQLIELQSALDNLP